MAHQFGNDQRLDAGWLALTNRLHIEGARYLDRLLESFPTPEAIIKGLHCEAGRDVVIAIKQAFRQSAPNLLSRGLTTELPLWLVTPQDVEYPPLLAECEDRPPFLFVRGELECLGARTLSVVGSRKPSLGGRKATAEPTAAAVSADQVIVSGLALGIDGIAHQAALQAGGASIAVLPCGIDRAYPRRHTVLAERLIKVGAVVSEFPLGAPHGNITFIDAIARCRVSVCRRWSWRRADPVAHCLPHPQRLIRVVMSSRCRGLSTTSVEQAVVIYYRTAPP